MQDRTRQFIQPGFKQRQKTVMRIPAVHKHRHAQLCRQRKLGAKSVFLLSWRGEIAIKIEAAFTDSHHFRRGRQGTQDIKTFRPPLAAVVGVNTGGRPAVWIALRQLSRQVAFMKIGARQQQAIYPCVECPGDHLITIVRKLRAGQVQTDIKHAVSHMTTALTGGWYYSSVVCSDSSS
ncbi:hypothetical protein D3C75_260740 [compost metagenome]